MLTSNKHDGGSNKGVERTEMLKERKRESRNDETAIVDAVIYLLVSEGYEVVVRRSRKTTKTVKMLLPEKVSKNGEVLDAKQICKLSQNFLTSFGYESLSKEIISKMTKKQAKRTKEAQMNNGLMYLLTREGYLIHEKKTKTARLTEKLVRISSIEKSSITYEKQLLIEMGKSISEVMDENIKKKTVTFNINLPQSHQQQQLDLNTSVNTTTPLQPIMNVAEPNIQQPLEENCPQFIVFDYGVGRDEQYDYSSFIQPQP